jgi:hypothetical protein
MPFMIEADGRSDISPTTQFDLLVQQIELEERRSYAATHPIAPNKSIDQIHHQMLATMNVLATHDQMRSMHIAMFKVHRKIHQRHQLALHHCRLLQVKVRAGAYDSVETIEVIREIHTLLARIRWENEMIERDRLKIKSEHDAFMATLGQNPTDL